MSQITTTGDASNSGGPSFASRQQTELNAERLRLLGEVAAIDTELAQLRDNTGPSEVDFGEEGGEGGTASVERDRNEAVRGSLMTQLDSVDSALARIEAGTYGICRTCGGEIGEARLEALPAATECVRCKSASPLRRR